MNVLGVCLMALLLPGPGRNLQAQAIPARADALALHAFEEPLDPLGRGGSLEEAGTLHAALDAYVRTGRNESLGPLEAYLMAYPASPWGASLHMNIGLVLRRAGWPGRAVGHFQSAWMLAKSDSSPIGRRIADRAIAEWMWLCVKAGDDATLEKLLKETKERPMRGGPAQRRADAERALFAMQTEAKFYLCGPTALATVNQLLKPNHPVDSRDVKDTIPGPNGTSLFQLAMMASNWDIPLQMLKRDPGAKVLTPSVMHWRVGHWAAVLQESGGRYLIQEDVMEETTWVSGEALDSESSGYCLAPYVPLPKGWSRVSAEVGRTVWGRGRVGIGPWYGPYSDSLLRPAISPASSVAQAGVRMGNLSLEVWFAPVSLPRHDGPAWPFELRYQQRSNWQPDRPTYSHLGPHWTFTGISFLLEDTAFEQQDVYLFTEEGTWLRFTGLDPVTGRYARNTHTRDLLMRLGVGRFELHRPDGSVESYSHAVSAGPSLQRVFRNELKTSTGLNLRYEFDGTHRLRRMTDEAGKGFTLYYEDSEDVYRLSRVVDSYGREARFTFNHDGELVEILDATNRKTRFSYSDKGVEPDVLQGLSTPEGAWVFEHGQQGLARWVELVDPSGKRHRSEFCHDAPGLPHVDASAPPGPLNQYMHDRSTYYWGPEVLSRHRGDYSKAESIRYLFNPTQLALSWSLEAIKEAEAPRIWFLYPGQVNTQVEGQRSNPRWVAQRTPKGDRTWDLRWDDLGRLVELQGGQGVHEIWSYAAGPGFHPETVNRGRLESNLRWESDVAGRCTQVWEGRRSLWKAERNDRGTILKIIDAKARNWVFDYDQTGRWVGIKGPSSFQWTYDTLGRVATLREGRGIPMNLSYDGLDRFLGSGDSVTGRARPGMKSGKTTRAVHADELLLWAGIQKPSRFLPIPSVARTWLEELGGNNGAEYQLKLKRTSSRSTGSILGKWCDVLAELEPPGIKNVIENGRRQRSCLSRLEDSSAFK